MDRWWVRSAAISCVFAACTMVVGPGYVGTAVAHAGLFGIGPDIDIFDLFGEDGRKRSEKSNAHHSRPDGLTTVQTQAPAKKSRAATGVASAPTAKVGSVPGGVTARQFAASSADNVNVPRSANVRGAADVEDDEDDGGRGDGRGALPRISASGRAANLAPVPTAPSTRSVVIRGTPSTAGSSGAPTAASPQLPEVSSAPRVTVTAPLAAPPPEAPEGRQAPAGPPAPSLESSPAKDPGAPTVSGIGRIPDSYRVGYAEYLRSASTGELFVAALPGVAGIAGFTLIGAYVGYRQARALQLALMAPVPTRIVM